MQKMPWTYLLIFASLVAASGFIFWLITHPLNTTTAANRTASPLERMSDASSFNDRWHGEWPKQHDAWH